MGNRYREEVLRVELLPLTIDLSLFRKKITTNVLTFIIDQYFLKIIVRVDNRKHK